MIFESQQKRAVWFLMFVGLIPDAILGLIAAYFSEGDSGFVAFLVVFIGIQVVGVLLWVKNTIWDWVFFNYYGRKALQEHLLSSFRKTGFPAPEYAETSAQGYFARIADDEEQPINLRLKAAVEVGSLSYSGATGKFMESLRVGIAYEDAIKRLST